MSRLSTIAPDVAARLKAQPDSSLRRIARYIALVAVKETGLDDPRAAHALEALNRADTRVTDVRSEVEKIVHELDEVAWQVQAKLEEGRASHADYLLAFGRARAAAAVWFALSEDALEAAIESAYEAQAATGDVEMIRATLERALADGH